MSVVTIAQVDAALPSWERDMTEAGLAEGTRTNYMKHAGLFLDWAADWDDPLRSRVVLEGQAMRFALERYTRWMHGERYAPGYVDQAIIGVDKMALWLGLGSVRLPLQRRPRYAPDALSPAEQRRFLRAAEQPLYGRWADVRCVRDTAIARLLMGCGPRVQELVSLDVGDTPLGGKRGRVRLFGKGGKVRFVPVNKPGTEALYAWRDMHARLLRPHRVTGDTPLLVTNRGRITKETVRDVVVEIGRRARLEERVNPHRLRHSFATNLVRSGVDLVVVADLLGHASLDTVVPYTLPTRQDVAAAVERVWPDR